MRRGIHRLWGLLLVLMLMVLAALPAQGAYRISDDRASGASNDYAFVRFNDPPLASYNGGIGGYDATQPAKGQKLDLNSPAAKKYGQRLQAQRENYLKWLARQHPQVQVVTEYSVTYNGVGLKLNGATLKQISAGPGAVETGVAGTYYKAMNTSHDVIKTEAIWEALGGQTNAGAEIMVGVIDSGIKHDHEFLHDIGMTAPAGFPKAAPQFMEFTSNKVIVAKVFHQDPWQTPEAVDSHGTHVSGTIAGRADTAGEYATGLSGVAPGAWLGNYNVFPGTTASAYSLFIAKAVEEAVIDGMDVLNLSLGGAAHKGADLLDMAVNAAVDAGTVVVISAGNSGPAHYTVGSPGTAGNVITVAAVTNGHHFPLYVESEVLAEEYFPDHMTLGTTGDGFGELREDMTGQYAVWEELFPTNTLACSPAPEGTDLEGKIALIPRGTCTFSTKLINAYAAGASAVLLYTYEGTDPIPMATPGVEIPAVMVNYLAGRALVMAPAGSRTVTLHRPVEEPDAAAELADFSSWGPTPNYTLKPDVAAPGVNIYSSVVDEVVGSNDWYAPYAGTSMAAPHVSGAAALLLALHSDWGPGEVKAALMGTASPVVSTDDPDAEYDADDPLKVGAGLIDLSRAQDPPAMAFPSSLSFGLVRPVGGHSYSLILTLANPTASGKTYTLAAPTELALSETEVTVPPGEERTVTVTVVDTGQPTPGQGGLPEFRSGVIMVNSAAGSIRVPYLYIIDYNR